MTIRTMAAPRTGLLPLSMNLTHVAHLHTSLRKDSESMISIDMPGHA